MRGKVKKQLIEMPSIILYVIIALAINE